MHAFDLFGISPLPSLDLDALEAVELLHHRWVPVVELTLEAEHPTIQRRVFRGFHRRSPVAALRGLVDELCALSTGNERAQVARASLSLAGIDNAELEAVDQLVLRAEVAELAPPATRSKRARLRLVPP
jgi:hypothetical protein